MIPPRLTGAAIRTLMRKNRRTIRGVAQQYGLTQARVRHVRAQGVAGEAFVRDWLEITGGAPACACATCARMTSTQSGGAHA